MLTVSLFNGTTKIHDKLVRQVPQGLDGKRHLIMLAVIHEPDHKADVFKPKVMLYQEVGDPEHFWIRKETPSGDGHTNYSETEAEDAITALGSFERATQLLMDELIVERSANRLDQAASTMEKVMTTEAAVRRPAS